MPYPWPFAWVDMKGIDLVDSTVHTVSGLYTALHSTGYPVFKNWKVAGMEIPPRFLPITYDEVEDTVLINNMILVDSSDRVTIPGLLPDLDQLATSVNGHFTPESPYVGFSVVDVAVPVPDVVQLTQSDAMYLSHSYNDTYSSGSYYAQYDLETEGNYDLYSLDGLIESGGGLLLFHGPTSWSYDYAVLTQEDPSLASTPRDRRVGTYINTSAGYGFGFTDAQVTKSKYLLAHKLFRDQIYICPALETVS